MRKNGFDEMMDLTKGLNPMFWYKRADVKFEIIKFSNNREFALLVPKHGSKPQKSTRNLRMHSVQHLDFFLKDLFNIFDNGQQFNLYYSMAHFSNGIPHFSANLKERDTTEWNKEYYMYMSGYDWLIDIDSPTHEDLDYAYSSAVMIKKLFDSCCVPYELRFSGCGYHFVVPYYFFNDLNPVLNPHKPNNHYQFLTKLNKILYDNYSELVDWNISDSRRLCKLPYSLALYEGKEYVCTPFLNDDDFDVFTPVDSRPSQNSLQGRGTHLFNGINTDCNKLLKKLGVKKNGERM